MSDVPADADRFDDSATPLATSVDTSARVPPFDATSAVLVGHASGPAIPESSFTPARLKAVFGAPRPWQPEATDEVLKPRFRRGLADYVPASVLVPIVVHPHGPTMLLTQRTAHLNAHAGQVSFPGGSAEPADADVVETALRETMEEIGLARSHVEVIGRMTDYLTVTGFRVATIVALVHPPFTLTLDAFEVAEAFEVPLKFLLDPANHERRRVVTSNGETRRFTAMPHGPHFIWGATAAMLRNFYLFMAAQEAA